MRLQDDVHSIAKLRWACRRGMLELDVLLENFLHQAYPGLPLEEKTLFVQLIDCNDADLFAWLLGQKTPQEVGLLRIVEIIRQHARS